MICERVKVPGGTVILCSRGRRRPKPCNFCGNPSSLLCDGKSPSRKGTCSQPLCMQCATSRSDPTKPGGTFDLCPECVKKPAPPEQLTLGGHRG